MHQTSRRLTQGTQGFLQSGAFRATWLVVCTLAWLSGCVAGPDYHRPTAVDLGLSSQPLPSSPSGPHGPSARFDHWWSSFKDPLLSRFVERAAVDNPDLETTRQRWLQAIAQAGSASAERWPQVSMSASSTHTSGSSLAQENGAQYTIGPRASWEIDLFGGLRRSAQAAAANAQSRLASFYAIRLSIEGETARYYVEARRAQARLAVAHANLSSQTETLRIARWRARAGLVSAVDEAQARQLVAQTSAAVPALEGDYRSAINRLSALLGGAPGEVDLAMSVPQPIPQTHLPASPTLPAKILRRRPDVWASERTLAAETARIGVAKALWYPSLELSGASLGSAAQLGNALDTVVTTLSASVAATLFDGGQRRSEIAAQQAAANAALADYRSTVLAALEESDNAFAAANVATRRRAMLADAAVAARDAADLLRAQYQSGLIDFTSLLEAERTELSSDDALMSAQAVEAQSAITLIQALGGELSNQEQAAFAEPKDSP